MYTILKKLFLGDKEETTDAILDLYEHQHYATVSYLYFGPIVTHRVFEHTRNANQALYKKHLLETDFLLPDGIALQIFYFIASILGRIKTKTYRFHNLNGTDFFPYFVRQVKKRYGSEKINFIFYGVYDQRDATIHNQYGATKQYGTAKHQYKEARIAAIKKHFNLPVVYYYESNFTDNSFTDFPFEDMAKHLKPNAVNIVMNCRGVPRQEFWSQINQENIKKYRLLVFDQGATIDYLCGFEVRAPQLLIWMKLEWLWRLITKPHRNIKKGAGYLRLVPLYFFYLLLKKGPR